MKLREIKMGALTEDRMDIFMVSKSCPKKGSFLGIPWRSSGIRIPCFHCQGYGELRSHNLCCRKKKGSFLKRSENLSPQSEKYLLITLKIFQRPGNFFLPFFSEILASLLPQGLSDGSDGKESASVQETWVWSLGPEDPLEEGLATHSSILAWRIPWTEEPGEL